MEIWLDVGIGDVEGGCSTGHVVEDTLLELMATPQAKTALKLVVFAALELAHPGTVI